MKKMPIMPVNRSKQTVQDRFLEYCIKENVYNVFSLLGTDASAEIRFPSWITVDSAEYNKQVFEYQKEKFKNKLNFNLYHGRADEVLAKLDKLYDVIWLDFSGNCTAKRNGVAIDLARRKLTKNGTIFVTSQVDARLVNHKNPFGMFQNHFKVVKRAGYLNGSSGKMKMEIFKLQKPIFITKKEYENMKKLGQIIS